MMYCCCTHLSMFKFGKIFMHLKGLFYFLALYYAIKRYFLMDKMENSFVFRVTCTMQLTSTGM